MKIFKKIAALVLVAAFVLSLAGCHPKDETAIISGDYKVTSALYSYYLVMADSEAKSIIDNSDDYDTSKKGFSYYKQKIDHLKSEIKKEENFLKYIKPMLEKPVIVDPDEYKKWLDIYYIIKEKILNYKI